MSTFIDDVLHFSVHLCRHESNEAKYNDVCLPLSTTFSTSVFISAAMNPMKLNITISTFIDDILHFSVHLCGHESNEAKYNDVCLPLSTTFSTSVFISAAMNPMKLNITISTFINDILHFSVHLCSHESNEAKYNDLYLYQRHSPLQCSSLQP